MATDGPFRPTPKDVTGIGIADPKYDDLREDAERPDHPGVLIKLEGQKSKPPFLGAKVDRLCRVNPGEPLPYNLLRDVREIVEYLDGVVPTHNYYEGPTLDQTKRVGNQIALRRDLHSDEAFMIELYPALAEQPDAPKSPDDIIDWSTKVQIMYYRHEFLPDNVGFLDIQYIQKVLNKPNVIFDTGKIAFGTPTTSNDIFQVPDTLGRKLRLDWKTEHGGRDILDPRFKN